jgi:hypothetical protein
MGVQVVTSHIDNLFSAAYTNQEQSGENAATSADLPSGRRTIKVAGVAHPDSNLGMFRNLEAYVLNSMLVDGNRGIAET